MAGSFSHFGTGTVERDGLKWGYHAWPIAGFKLHFTNEFEFRNLDFKSEEDWKAAIYAWGGPKPSMIAKAEVSFNKEKMEFMILYLEKHHDNGIQQERSLDQPGEVFVRSDGQSQH